MTTAVQCDFCPNPYLGALLTSPGVSDESNLCEREIKAQVSELQSARDTGIVRAQNAHGKLNNLFKDCRSVGWNGRDATPIPRAAIVEAEQLIALIPERYPMPDIIPETTGEIGLEWYVDPYRVLLLSVAGDGYIYYAGLYGFKNADHGSKPLAGQLNKKIISLLDDVYKDVAPAP